MGYSPWRHKELDMTEHLSTAHINNVLLLLTLLLHASCYISKPSPASSFFICHASGITKLLEERQVLTEESCTLAS